ncbi:hypothetical protein DHEL01_v209659 [Diaporthe helianthi]|uniref:Siderophore biosynthesis enzyme n=1 Tax=Diaporthe helianthi TaxID=158607 RepID=A0A2P5HNU7_DIAHE|nr:hypothetical protein DHEL01_v209659 [Diaporthe helianthi]
MKHSTHLTLASLLALSPLPTIAKTDLSGCTSFNSTVTANPTAAHEYGNVYPSIFYYVPDTLEICSILDCGGGRAPPKTDVPGCPLYSGTEAPAEPSYLSADPLLVAPEVETAAAAHDEGVVPTASVADEDIPDVALETPDSMGDEIDDVAETDDVAESHEFVGTDELAETMDMLMAESETGVAVTVTSTLGPVHVNMTAAMGVAQATGMGLAGMRGNTSGKVIGNSTGSPSSPLDTTSSGERLGLAMGGLSVALAAAVAFVL